MWRLLYYTSSENIPRTIITQSLPPTDSGILNTADSLPYLVYTTDSNSTPRTISNTIVFLRPTNKNLELAHRLHNTFIAQLHETDALLTIIDACNNTYDQVDPAQDLTNDQVQELWRGCSRVAGHKTTLQTFLNMTHLYQVVLVYDLLQSKTYLGLLFIYFACNK